MLTIAIIVGAVVLFLWIMSHVQAKKEKEKLRTYRKRLEEDPCFGFRRN